AHCSEQLGTVRFLIALVDNVAQVVPMEAGDVLVRLAELELRQDVVPHAARSAGGEGGDRLIREGLAERAELALFGAGLGGPFGNAVCLVDSEERERYALKPGHGVLASQALG